MGTKNRIQLFQDQQIRTVWDADQEEWYFSIVDVVAVLTEQPDYKAAQNYWKVLKSRLKREGSELVTECNQLKMTAADGKQYNTSAATTEQLLRLIQSIPSKKAEPFKLWLAQVGNERLNELADPELTIDRAMHQYRALGYSEEWIKARLQSIFYRKKLTDEWDRSGVEEELEYALLTNLMTKEWSGKTVQEYKHHKDLHKESLRDNMTNVELLLTMLSEYSATAISKIDNPQGFDESAVIAHDGAKIAGDARRSLEKRIGQSVVSKRNAQDQPAHLDVGAPSKLKGLQDKATTCFDDE